jgi:molybdate transport system permease protein
MMETVLTPVLISLKIAFVATCFSLFIGTSLAYLLHKKNDKLGTIIETVILLPMVMPPTITGYLLLLILSDKGLFFAISGGNSLIFTWWAGVIASTIVSIPLMYQNSKSGFQSLNPVYKDIGKTLGLGRFKIIFKIELPLILPSILSGLVLSFARALGEFGATLMVAGSIPGKTRTIASAIYFAVESGDRDTANKLMFIMVVISFLLMFSLNIWLKRKRKYN